MKHLQSLLIILGLACVVGTLTMRAGDTQSLVQNQAVNISATSLPTGGVSGNMGNPRVAAYTTSFTNSGAATIYCGVYASPPTLATTATVGSVIAVPAGATVPKYIGPTNGVSRSSFPNGIYGGCATAYRGSTGVAQTTVDFEVTYL